MSRLYKWIPLVLAIGQVDAYVPNQEETMAIRQRMEELALSQSTFQCLAVPEGGFVYYSHPFVAPWLENPLTVEKIQEIRTTLAPHIQILLTKEGFTMASSRRGEDEIDESSYSAIWVRDCAWHYYGLKTYDTASAKILLLSLLNFYSSQEQKQRFLSVIQDPQLADPSCNPQAHMSVPLIRFSRETLTHHQIDGQDQEWNHLQFDSHGLFLLALSDALTSAIVLPEDLEQKHLEALSLFPAFFTETRYWEKGDAGPWEEELLNNASSAGLVASGLKRIMEVIGQTPLLTSNLEAALHHLSTTLDPAFMQKIEAALSPENMDNLYTLGIARVEKNLSLGGEAPALEQGKLDRKADAALLFLCFPEHALYGKNPQKMKEILTINSSLIGPYGVYRYKYDAYQALNYWITYDQPSAIFGPPTRERSFLDRLNKGYEPDKHIYDAQWFFDSNFSNIYYNLALQEKDLQIQAYYVRKGDYHLKRALGQLTGTDDYVSNGEKAKPLQLPESINTVRNAHGEFLPIASLICPLNWAVAALQMALESAEKAHVHVEN